MKMEQLPICENRGEMILSRTADLENLHLEYRLYETGFLIDRRHAYSIAVTAVSSDDCDQLCVCDVTRIKRRALSLFRLIADGLVTPCTLTDVLEDLL